MVKAFGIESSFANGNDVLEVYKKTQKAAKKIRLGEGPQFLEFETYRWREHCGPNFDNDIGYRTEEEYQEWRKKDPVAAFESRLSKEGIFSSSEQSLIREEIREEVDQAFAFAKNSKFPKSEEAFEDLFATKGASK